MQRKMENKPGKKPKFNSSFHLKRLDQIRTITVPAALVKIISFWNIRKLYINCSNEKLLFVFKWFSNIPQMQLVRHFYFWCQCKIRLIKRQQRNIAFQIKIFFYKRNALDVSSHGPSTKHYRLSILKKNTVLKITKN